MRLLLQSSLLMPVLHVLPVSQAVFSNLARGPGDPRGGMLLGVLSDKAADSIH